MWQANPIWGSPRIQAEPAKLGLKISDSTVRKYRPKHRRAPSAQTWKAFLHNHAKALVAIDFFTVPTATFRLLHVFLVLAHERRKVLHFNITEAPSALWTAQQMVEAFSFTSPPRYLLRDRDGIYGADCWIGKRRKGAGKVLVSRESAQKKLPTPGTFTATRTSVTSPAAYQDEPT